MKNALIIICLLILQSCSNDNEIAYYENFDMPIYPSGRNVILSNDSYIMAKKVNYELNGSFSPDKIFKYYNQKLSSFSFQENMRNTFYKYDISNSEFIADGNWNQPPAIYHKGWLNSDKNTIIKVSIHYKPENNTHVGILMHPNVNPELLNDFREYLKTLDNENDFYDLYSKYPGPGNTLDLQKALQQEPENQILKNFAEFEKQGRIELENNYEEFN
ncbi:hypothetical protein [Desulfosediminicola flagellatus]|uniref:hypothetical protein n=1 Tax=Desulfosediminicola flagellatus TaxID=2569541 RepID=UPI0010AC4F9D|nr:hypothetical protein [Desulfosediminicola flagellatus]